MQIVKFEISHFDRINLRDWDLMGTQHMDNVRERVEFYAGQGPSYTGMIDGEIMGCAGVFLHWPGMGEAWVFGSPLIERFKLSFHRVVKKTLNAIQTNLRLHRIQCVVHADYTRSQKWVERLGFIEEGLLNKYGPDQASYYMYGRCS